MKFLKLIIFAFLLIGPACKRDAGKVDPNLIGDWYSTDPAIDNFVRISIGSFSKYQSDTENHLGKAKVIKKKSELYINKKVLTIDKYPYQTTDSLGNSVWRMNLSNVEYEKQ
jgi:hypothetical protein